MSISNICIIKFMPFFVYDCSTVKALKHCVLYDKLLQRTFHQLTIQVGLFYDMASKDGPVHQSAYLCTCLSVLRTEIPATAEAKT